MIFILVLITATNAFPSHPGLTGCSFSTKFPPIDGQRGSYGYFNASFHTKYSNICDNLPNPRNVSNLLGQQSKSGNSYNVSAAWVYFGQFIDHDITLTPTGTQSMNIELFPGDQLYEINDGWFNFSRSILVSHNTAYLDLSSVYGDTAERNIALRTLKDGLLIDDHGFLPKQNNEYFCGDIRCNENPILTGHHYLFHAEHNRLAKEYKKAYPFYSDGHLFHLARLHNILQYQQIVYEEWLPIIIGLEPIKWQQYKDISPDTFFSTVAFRFGHSAIPNKILFRGEEKNLFDHFFQPEKVDKNNVADYMNGIASLIQEEIDLQLVDSLRNKLFVNEFQSLDLFSLNIQRGRDHEILAFDKYYKYFTGIKLISFDQLTQNKTISDKLKELYHDVACLDPFVGILAEDHAESSIAGLLIKMALRKQFETTAASDKYYYKRFPSNDYKTITELYKLHFDNNKVNVFRV